MIIRGVPCACRVDSMATHEEFHHQSFVHVSDYTVPPHIFTLLTRSYYRMGVCYHRTLCTQSMQPSQSATTNRWYVFYAGRESWKQPSRRTRQQIASIKPINKVTNSSTRGRRHRRQCLHHYCVVWWWEFTAAYSLIYVYHQWFESIITSMWNHRYGDFIPYSITVVTGNSNFPLSWSFFFFFRDRC